MLRFLLLFILVIIVARIFWRLVDGVIEGATGQSRRQVKRGDKLERDPVCGTFVSPGSALSLTAGGSTRYFCSEQCRSEFQHGKAQVGRER
jgi:YHS domain-containing protein